MNISIPYGRTHLQAELPDARVQAVLKSRLEYAMTLLHTTDKSVNDIALELGFYSLSHFSNYFKKETGTTPMLYRRSGML